ncbi:hypothetical protein C2134_02580 [Chromobacterium sinusclupearum]|uniref:HipA-like C-terminal domain-containing protein n=1 Tax=Chromobacterium sinusclupearum TaxID=2077146 RepID=A0A2K4MT95_9NEIS|nr:type II toxin-antitoxin system HipA family toxin YjjJ [Chromobacterium sinusclupearum]POB00304.1 hypothetical protein C2134_02580 [Chromobacterium sinusclupearum]
MAALSIESLLRSGPASASELQTRLGISQPTLSRAMKARLGLTIVRVGRTRQARYYGIRPVADQSQFPIYRVTPEGTVQPVGILYPVHGGFVVDREDGDPSVYAGLPWWLNDMRPQGFLGRAWARRNAGSLGLSADLLTWDDDAVLIALASGEHDMPGNLLVGDNSRAEWLACRPEDVPATERAARYPLLAMQATAGEAPGSSAAGEQPKFTAVVDGQSVIVKFSAAQDNAVSERWRNLLAAEHIALTLLNRSGLAAAESAVLDAGGQRFLQVTRFDRTPQGGRHGLVSLATLDAEFVGMGNGTWPEVTLALTRAVSPRSKQHIITAEAHQQACALFAFGRLIGNTDMHLGNIACFHEGPLPLSLAPIYDMLPMALSPQPGGAFQNELPPFRLTALPHADVWSAMVPLAREFWDLVEKDERVTPPFAQIARRQQAWLDEAERQIKRLG